MLSFRTVADLTRDLAHATPSLVRGVQAVIGVPRSGMLAASILALHAQLPLGTVDDYCHRAGNAGKAQRILLLDDTVAGGGTMRRAVAQVKAARPDATIIRAAVYHAGGTKLDRSVMHLPSPRCFEWNIYRSVHLPRIAFDLDGVICKDPTVIDDDGKNFENHVRTAVPLGLPTRRVGLIVTCRLEKWRPLTESWLKVHGVKFGKLHMMRYKNAQARRAAGRHGQWKADIFRNSKADLFVESSTRQSRVIAKDSGKPVWCIQDRLMYGKGA